MSVEAQASTGDDWTRWQGHLVDGVYPLGRLLGDSEHSGVFATKTAASDDRQVAIKLLAASPVQTELQLQRWALSGALTHPHLLSLLEWGSCQLDGFPYLFVVMEYADQTLAQLLQQRALTAEEAREMLVPILGAMEFLHHQGLLYGGLKPANVLVVGDQLKLASDTIRRVGEDAFGAPSGYDPPKGLDGNSPAGDVWGIGINLLEALTRRSPTNSVGHRSRVVLPADFPPDFRDIVTRCLSPNPQDRGSVTQLLDWASGRPAQTAPDAPTPPAAAEIREVQGSQTATPLSEPERPPLQASQPARLADPSAKPRALIFPTALCAVVFALSWIGIRSLTAHRIPEAASAVEDQAGSQPPGIDHATATAQAGPDLQSPFATDPSGGDASRGLAVREVVPTVPKKAARTIRGHVEVSVRATVNPDGSVASVMAERNGHSRYLQRLAVNAAKKWTFSPATGAVPRLIQLKFDFSRDGTEGHAALLR